MLRAEALALAEGGSEAVVQSVEYFGHDQLVTARLPSGSLLRVRLLAAAPMSDGQRISLAVRGEVVVLPLS
jgi:hypothetical protein